MKYLNVLSFGAGTQSTAMVLLALENKIDCDLIIFSDTGAETTETMNHALAMKKKVEENSEIPFMIIKAEEDAKENIESYLYGDGKACHFPFWVESGLMRRQCTANFKIVPIQKAIREHLGIAPKKWFPKSNIHINMMLGITTDEIMRAKDSREAWITNKFPLLELGWDRQKSIKYCNSKGIYPSSSACFFCPFKNKEEWQKLSENEPNLYQLAVLYDKQLRSDRVRNKGIRELMYLHKIKRPLNEAVTESKKQGTLFDDFYFKELECEGHCFL